MSQVWKRPVPLAVLIGAGAEALFLTRLSVPHRLVFDETHYVPAARTLLALAHPANTEHPLLGKVLIAAGIALFGDDPVGWRVMSTLAATAVVVGVFAILQLLYARVRTSALGAVLTVLSFTVYVQARVAMLDGFLAAFTVAAGALFVSATQRGGWARWLGCGACLGLATACKWTALPYAGLAGLSFLYLKRERGNRFAGVPMLGGALAFGGVAMAAYLITFAPAFWYADQPLTLSRLLPFQREMFAQQTQVLPSHTYQSRWWTWPFDIRPIWYFYDRADGAQRGILMLGNPAVIWGGLVAVVACGWAWVEDGDRRPLTLALLWLFSLAIWAAIPKSLGFFYYYYLSSIWLCLAIAAAFDHWRVRAPHWDAAFVAAAGVLFLYFFPILSAQALPSPEAFHRWIWFPTWV